MGLIMGGYTYILLSDTHTKVGMSKVEFPKRVKDQLGGRFKGFSHYATINDSFFEQPLINCLNPFAGYQREVFFRNDFMLGVFLDAMLDAKEVRVNRDSFCSCRKHGVRLAGDADELSKFAYKAVKGCFKSHYLSLNRLNYAVDIMERRFNYLARKCREKKPEIIFHQKEGCCQGG